MLLDQTEARRPERVAVQVRSPVVAHLLRTILAEWHFCVEPGPAGQTVALAEAGLPAPEGVRHTLWISPAAAGATAQLTLPLSLTSLYQALQGWFFPSPRRYLRLSLDRPAQLELRGAGFSARLVSISERGGRVAGPARLPMGETLQLTVNLDGYLLQAAAQVIYAIPAGDLPGGPPPQAGLLFKPLRAELAQALHRHVERTLLSRAAMLVGLADADPAWRWFDTVADPWSGLPPWPPQAPDR